jgi:hypothetical protein
VWKRNPAHLPIHITHHYGFLPHKLAADMLTVAHVSKSVYSLLQSSIQLKSIPPSCSKGEKKNMLLPGTALGREPRSKYACVGAGPSMGNAQLFGLSTTRGPLPWVTGDLCMSNLPLDLNFDSHTTK